MAYVGIDPNILSTTGVNASTYGRSTNVSVITVDEYGRITAAANVAVQGMDYAYVNTVAVLKTGNTMTGNLVMSGANIAFDTATNSGIYWSGTSFIHSPAANILVLGTSSVEDIRIDASGNVGIGTTTTSAKLDVNGTIRANVVNEVFSNVAMSGNTATLNLLSSSVFQINLSNNIGIFTWSNPPAGNTAYGFTLKIVQNTSARSITWPTSVDWAGATAPTLSSGSGNVDVFVFFTHDAGSNWYGFISGHDMR